MSRDVIVIGDSGHAKVCIEVLQSMGYNVAFCVGVTLGPPTCLGVPILKGDDHLVTLRKQGYSNIFVAIGANDIRQRIAKLALSLGYRLVNAISPSAIISPSAQLGLGIALMAGAIVNADTIIGDLTIVNTGACIDHDCHISIGAHIAPQCGLAGNVTVGEGSFLGIGCKVIPGIQIGSHVTIGAGAVVVSNIPNGTRAIGVPARLIDLKEE